MKLPDPPDSDKVLSHELFQNSEKSLIHTSYREEKALLTCVQDGDVERLIRAYESLPKTVYGHMSTGSRNLFYGSIANVTLVTRYAIEGGMDEEEAFSLSDIYIRKMERLNDEQLEEENIRMVLDFTRRVALARKAGHRYSPEVEQCIDYIDSHRYQKIALSELAANVHLSVSYLCRLFQKETGDTPGQFMQKKRIEEAKRLLRFSDYSYAEIAENLNYSSQSHFTAAFRKYTGITPQAYRNSASDK